MDNIYYKVFLQALRKEYIKNENKLRKLNQLIEIDDKKINSASFYLDKKDFNKAKICLKIIKKANIFALSNNIESIELNNILYNSSNIYIKERKYFDEITNSILNSNFALNIYNCYKCNEFLIETTGRRMDITPLVDDLCTSISYESDNDSIQIVDIEPNINNNIINSILNYPIDFDKLPIYYQEIIKNNKDSKEIILPHDLSIKKTKDNIYYGNYNLEEDNNSIKLVPNKRKIKKLYY